MRINNNMMAMNTHRQLGAANAGSAKSIEKLSSGLRINRAGDDAAGLAISEKMRGQIRGLNQASANSQDGISMIQTAEGALNETHAILQRMRELAVQSATDTNTSTDRGEIQKEVDQLAKEITRISNTTEFNTQNLLAGGLNNTFHVGANKGQNVSLSVNAMDAFALGVATGAKTGATSANNTAVLTTVSNVGDGLVDPAYRVTVTSNIANIASAGATTATGTSAPAGTIGGTYEGRNDISAGQLIVEAVTVDGDNRVATARVSRDGGNTWKDIGSGDISGTGASARTIDLGEGLTLSVADAATNADNKWVSTDVITAATKVVQLTDNSGNTIGGTTTVRNGDTSASIGNSATFETVTVGFANFGSLTASTAGATEIAINTDSSNSATFNPDGTIAIESKASAGITVKTQAQADIAIEKINDAIEKVSGERSKLGAMQNRLEHTIKNLDTSSENLQASEARIRDVDMAKEMMEQTKQNILSQASTAMLANANQAPQTVLQLLR